MCRSVEVIRCRDRTVGVALALEPNFGEIGRTSFPVKQQASEVIKVNKNTNILWKLVSIYFCISENNQFRWLSSGCDVIYRSTQQNILQIWRQNEDSFSQCTQESLAAEVRLLLQLFHLRHGELWALDSQWWCFTVSCFRICCSTPNTTRWRNSFFTPTSRVTTTSTCEYQQTMFKQSSLSLLTKTVVSSSD